MKENCNRKGLDSGRAWAFRYFKVIVPILTGIFILTGCAESRGAEENGFEAGREEESGEGKTEEVKTGEGKTGEPEAGEIKAEPDGSLPEESVEEDSAEIQREPEVTELKQVMLVPGQSETDIPIYGKTGMGKAEGIVVDAWFTGFAESAEGNRYFCVYLGRTDGMEVSSLHFPDCRII